MPTYAYRGIDCGHEFETYQSFSDDALTECPECSGPVRKVVSGVGVTFKGSGFYRTDSRAESSSAKREKSSTGSPGKGAASEKKAKDTTASSPGANSSPATSSPTSSSAASSPA